MKTQRESSVALLETEHTKTIDPVTKPANRSWKKSAGMFSDRKSQGGILVVDDDPDIRKLIRLILENSGYDILEAENGQEAMDLLRSGENPLVIDTIISDLTMPKVDGYEAIAYFQKEFPSIPIIVLTGIADLEVATSFMRRGISNYLVKPVDGKKLTTSVANAIAQRQLSWV